MKCPFIFLIIFSGSSLTMILPRGLNEDHGLIVLDTNGNIVSEIVLKDVGFTISQIV